MIKLLLNLRNSKPDTTISGCCNLYAHKNLGELPDEIDL